MDDKRLFELKNLNSCENVEELKFCLQEFEDVYTNRGIKNKHDLKIFQVVAEADSYAYYNYSKFSKSVSYLMAYFINYEAYKSGNISKWVKQDIEEHKDYRPLNVEDFPGILKFCKDRSIYDLKNDNGDLKEFIKEKFNFVDEAVFSTANYFLGITILKNIKENLKLEIIKYNLKKKPKKEYFNQLLRANVLNDKILEQVKLTDIQLVNFIYSILKQYIKKRVEIGTLTELKILRKIKGSFSESVILTLVQRFIKDAEKTNMSEGTIEVILSMFMHYMGFKIEDFSDAALLLALSFDKEIEI